MTRPLPFDLSVGPAGLERLVFHPVDCAGVDLTPHARAVGLRWQEGEVPVLVVELHADATDTDTTDGVGGVWAALEVEGFVQVVTPPGPADPVDPAAMVADWLGALDPAEVERLMLERSGANTGERTTGQLALGALRALATG